MTHVNDLLMKARCPIFTTFTPSIVGGIITCLGHESLYHVIVPLLLSKVKYDSSVGLLEQEFPPDQFPEPLPEPDPLLPLFIPKSAFSSKLPSLRALSDQVETSVDTYPSAHEDPTMISSMLASLKEISLLPVPVTPD